MVGMVYAGHAAARWCDVYDKAGDMSKIADRYFFIGWTIAGQSPMISGRSEERITP